MRTNIRKKEVEMKEQKKKVEEWKGEDKERGREEGKKEDNMGG